MPAEKNFGLFQDPFHPHSHNIFRIFNQYGENTSKNIKNRLQMASFNNTYLFMVIPVLSMQRIIHILHRLTRKM